MSNSKGKGKRTKRQRGKWARVLIPKLGLSQHFHNGDAIDLLAPTGTKVYAPVAGRVYHMSEPTGCGTYIKLRKRNSLTYFLFCHLEKYVAKNGERVAAGDLIGITDNTGNSEGPHLHFAYHPGGISWHGKDPEPGYLRSYEKPWVG